MVLCTFNISEKADKVIADFLENKGSGNKGEAINAILEEYAEMKKVRK